MFYYGFETNNCKELRVSDKRDVYFYSFYKFTLKLLQKHIYIYIYIYISYHTQYHNDSFFVLVFFLSGSLCPLSLSLSTDFDPLFFSSFSSVFVRLCFFSDLLFKGGGAGQCFPLSVSVFPLLILSDLPSLGFIFFCLFVILCLLALSFAFCVYHSLPVFCVPLCVCPLFLFLFVLWFSSVNPRGPFCFLSLSFVLLVTSPLLSWPFFGFYKARECHTFVPR